MEPDDTFTDLKAHYQDKTVPAVAFVFCTMADHHTLADYNIPQGSSRSMDGAATSLTTVVFVSPGKRQRSQRWHASCKLSVGSA